MSMHIEWGRVLALPVTVGFVAFCGWLTNRLGRPRTPRRVALTPHIHVVDWTRSEIALFPDGSIEGRCCVAGCDQVVRVADYRCAVDPLPEINTQEGTCQS